MADIMSRIILQAQGGDQAAREVGKVTEAYEKAGRASKGIGGDVSTGGAAGDPFARATAPGGFIPSTQQGRDAQNQQYWEGVQRRENRHTALSRVNQRAVGGVQAAGRIGADDIVGGTTQGLGLIAGGGIAGLIAGVAAA